ncbi:VOC family protein [Granulicella arctica]|uniref:VOC family protein n=1 Tax=Granulicella arctica TaxID=940613 RepID=UPI0021DF9C32|nr:VOC family protein [Granulicella arctica]
MLSTPENGTMPTHNGRSSLLSAVTRLGKVGLIVSDLQRSLEFYSEVIGLQILARSEGLVQLGVAAEHRVLLELESGDGVRALTGKRLGLYHFALLLPSRADLSSFAEHLQAAGIRAGMSDHLVSEAFYLGDPDGLQIEVYADRDPQQWLWEGDEIAVATQPLNLGELLSQPHPLWAGVPPGSTIGHIHLYIGDIPRAEQLYRHGLGMNVRARGFPGALFLAAGKYHHHIGLNTWAGNVPAASKTEARLSTWELQVQPSELISLCERLVSTGWKLSENTSFLDPWGIVLKVTALSEPG